MGYRLVLAWSGVVNNVLPRLYTDLRAACAEAERVVDQLPPRSRPRIGLVCTVVDVTTGATLATFTRRQTDSRPMIVDLPAATLDRARQQAARDGRTVEGLVREATELALGVWTEGSTGEEP